jgi:hypothetical protein
MKASNTGRSAAAQLRELGHGIPGEDSPRWHLVAAEEAMDEGGWDAARVALQRARENLAPEAPDGVEARFVAIRLAVATVDLRAATEETMALVESMDEKDATWNRRVRAIIAAAPRVFTSSMRAGITSLLPSLPAEGHAQAAAVAPTGDEDAEEPDLFPGGGDVGPTSAAPAAPECADYEVWVDDGDGTPNSAEPAAPADGALAVRGRWHVRIDPAVDAENADELRDHLVERMLAEVSDEEFQVLFDTATTFLANGQYETAELMFSAAMQAPELRVAACEGLVQALVLGGRHSDAIANAQRATRVFARERDHLAGVLYWQGVAAQETGDTGMARECFDRVLAAAPGVFPDLSARREGVRA